MNPLLTNAGDYLRAHLLRIGDRLGRLISQASARAARATTLARHARAAYALLVKSMDDVQRAIIEKIRARRMAIRRLFLVDPDPRIRPEFNRDGKLVLTYLSRCAGVLSAESSTDPVALAKAEGRREILAVLWKELFDELPELAAFLAEEERLAAQEIVPA